MFIIIVIIVLKSDKLWIRGWDVGQFWLMHDIINQWEQFGWLDLKVLQYSHEQVNVEKYFKKNILH